VYVGTLNGRVGAWVNNKPHSIKEEGEGAGGKEAETEDGIRRVGVCGL